MTEGTQQAQPADPTGGSPAGAQPEVQQEKSVTERRQILSRHIQMAVTAGGRVESQSEDSAVIVKGKPVNHVLHFFIGLFTCGLWWLAWAVLALTGGEKREMITVDDWGNVAVQRV